jgi:hypothetical protein
LWRRIWRGSNERWIGGFQQVLSAWGGTSEYDMGILYMAYGCKSGLAFCTTGEIHARVGLDVAMRGLWMRCTLDGDHPPPPTRRFRPAHATTLPLPKLITEPLHSSLAFSLYNLRLPPTPNLFTSLSAAGSGNAFTMTQKSHETLPSHKQP